VPGRYLPIYLNDHLFGATVGVELARRVRSSNEGGELGGFLAGLCEELEDDRARLREAMHGLGVAVNPLKPVGGWMAEKAGRLKLNGQLRGYSPLSRVIELEGLAIAINANLACWQALERCGEGAGVDFAELAQRSRAQLRRLEPHRLEADRAAFG
jgi:hypothetical protein